MKTIEPFALKFIIGILITLFSIVGCSDMPYTGQLLTVNEVDRYLVSTDGKCCLLSGRSRLNLHKNWTRNSKRNGYHQRSCHPHLSRADGYIFSIMKGTLFSAAERVGDNTGNNGSGGNNNNNTGNNGTITAITIITTITTAIMGTITAITTITTAIMAITAVHRMMIIQVIMVVIQVIMEPVPPTDPPAGGPVNA